MRKDELPFWVEPTGGKLTSGVTITRRCGHTEELFIKNRSFAKMEKEMNHLKRQLCTDCYKKGVLR